MPPLNPDLFSRQAAEYARHRPRYPPALFAFLAELCPVREVAWDVGTGNGQSAAELARVFARVVATDISAAQLSHAPALPNVRYAATPPAMDDAHVRHTVGPPASVDLVTVAQAMHWFDFDRFAANVHAVLKPRTGVVAAWCYTLPRVNPVVDVALDRFYKRSDPFWEPRRRYIDRCYRDIPFPFHPLPQLQGQGTGPLRFESFVEWTVNDVLGFLSSWSAVATAKAKGVDLLTAEACAELEGAWLAGEGDGGEGGKERSSSEVRRKVCFPIYMRAGTA
ncbi:hypothetical protein CLOM_g7776 [Closterium sp. NIES-68]|nr:hypothetical protein CLOM_g7776 [Closterium sp. NIES-68]GJP59612.1 hypothetical protein CLOP_g13135 [Closterium sp. NIES-67]